MKIVSLHKVGLVGRKDKPWAKDSIDFIALVCDENKDTHLWGVEIKSRQKLSTITEEKENMKKLRRHKYEKIMAGDAHKVVHKHMRGSSSYTMHLFMGLRRLF